MSQFEPKNILVTGSAGFIGCNFVRYILSNHINVQVVSLDKLTYAGSKENLENMPGAERHVFVEGDICDAVLVGELLRRYEIDTIVHFAAESHVDRSITGPAEFIQTNIVGTFTLLEAVRNYWLEELGKDECGCRFHHVSTDEVYGQLKNDDPAFSETTRYQPSSPYSASKASSDHLVRSYFHTYNLPVTISNCSNNYGPYQHEEKLIPTVIKCCIEQRSIPVYGNGMNIRDWLYVGDHCSAINAIIERGKIGETYNVGGKNEQNNLDLIKAICLIMDGKFSGRKPCEQLVSFVTNRLGHDWRYAIDNSKIQNDLNWEPAVSFDQGLDSTISYYLNLLG